MTQRQIDILEIFAEAQRRGMAGHGDRWLYAMPHASNELFGVRTFEPDDRATELENYIVKRRIKTLAAYKLRLQKGERPRGLNIKLWAQAAAALGIVLTVTRPAGTG